MVAKNSYSLNLIFLKVDNNWFIKNLSWKVHLDNIFLAILMSKTFVYQIFLIFFYAFIFGYLVDVFLPYDT